MDKYGLCPNCSTNWNMGDIRQNLGNLSIFKHKSEYEVTKVAALYGWTEFNKGNFSSVIATTLEDSRTILLCPEVRCGHYFDSATGNEYDNLIDAINKENEIIREEKKKVEVIDGGTMDSIEDFNNFFK